LLTFYDEVNRPPPPHTLAMDCATTIGPKQLWIEISETMNENKPFFPVSFYSQVFFIREKPEKHIF
jgi:hypothetical protein